MAAFDDPAFYGDRWADVYDKAPKPDPAAAVDFLADLAGDGRVLELAIGTGRVALPLSARGIAVEGVEASAAMVERLRGKLGGERIPTVVGDMADVPVKGTFRLVYLVFNSLFCLLTAERQAECFRNVARVLDVDGALVIECYVPDPSQFDHGQRVDALDVTEDSATIGVYRHDAEAQRFNSQKITFSAAGIQLQPLAQRYSWPDELDEMAEHAGLRLGERHGDWDRRPFDSVSVNHISVYRPR